MRRRIGKSICRATCMCSLLACLCTYNTCRCNNTCMLHAKLNMDSNINKYIHVCTVSRIYINYPSTSLSLYLSVCLSGCLSVCLSACLAGCLSVCPSFYLFIFIHDCKQVSVNSMSLYQSTHSCTPTYVFMYLSDISLNPKPSTLKRYTYRNASKGPRAHISVGPGPPKRGWDCRDSFTEGFKAYGA